jgi:hydroxylysine kinase
MGVRELLSAELAAPFERTTSADAEALVARHWGLRAERAVRVDTERDDTFHVETTDDSGGGAYALKVAHPLDDPGMIDLQVAAAHWAVEHDPTLPIPTFLPTLDGTLQPVVGGRIVRLMPWAEGQSLRAALWDAAPSSTLLHAIGSTQARLTAALAEFRHPSESRMLAWNVAELPELASLIDSVADAAPVADALERHVRDVTPRLGALPQQLIHNDGNLDNLLVDERATAVVAILDFGDVVRTARVLDLAVTASYLLPADDQYSASDTLAGLVAGWETVLPLEDDERELLPRLVIARLLQRILLGSWLSGELPDNAEYLGRNIEHTQAQLANAISEGF